MKNNWLKLTKLLSVLGLATLFVTSLIFIGCSPADGGNTPADKAPGAPTNLTAESGDGKVTLTWQAPADTGIIGGNGTAGSITGYTVYYSETQGFAVSDAAGVTKKEVDASVLTTSITSLTNGTTYYFKVTARNATGESAPGTEASAVPRANESLPDAPTGLSFAAYTYDSTANTSGLTLSWTAPSFTGLQGGTATALTGYTIYYAKTENFDTADANTESETIADAATLTKVLTDLDAGTQYYFKVTASNAVGASTASAEEATFTNGPPGKPSDIVFDTYTGTSLNISWTAAHPGYKDGNEATMSKYTVYYGTSAGFDITAAGIQKVDTANGTTLTAAISGLTNGTGYYFKVSATNEFGEGSVSEERLIAANAPPGAPRNLRFSAYSKTGLTVSWEAPGDTGFEGGSAGTLSGYKVYYSTTSGFDLSSVTPTTISDPNTTSQAITGLSAGTQYYFKVTASNSSGDSGAAEASTHTDGAPEAPSILSINGHSETGLTVNWVVAGTGYKDGSPAALSGFKVYYSKTSGFGLTDTNTGSEVVSDGTATSQAISGLDAGTQYYFKVTASNAVGESTESTEEDTYTNKASGSPGNFAATPASGEAELRWSAPTDKGYIAGAAATDISYKVYSSSSDISDVTSLTPVYTGANLNYTFSGTAGEAYYFAITANNGGKDSPLAKIGPFTLISSVTHQLHLNSNGGAGAVETTDFTNGVATAIPAPTGITKSGSTLAVWNTAADGSGTYYDLTEEITLTADLTLYAMWSTDGLAYTLINSDTEYSVKKGSATATEIEVPGYWMGKKVTEVGTEAFDNYTALTDIKLPSTITVIQSAAFQFCRNLALSSLPDSIVSIGSNAFQGTNLTLTSLPSGLKRLESSVFSSCGNVNLTSLPDGLESIGESSLSGTKSSFTTLPGSVTTLDYRAFYGTAMTSMTIPATVTSIGPEIFNWNNAITEVTLEGNYDSLNSTFYTDSSNGQLATVKITNDTTPATLSGTVFPNTVTSIQVPASAVTDYKNAWTAHESIISALP